MTTVDAARGTDEQADPTLADDLSQLRHVLADVEFPAVQDDLIAAVLGRGAPTRLACRLSKIPRETRYPDLESALADVRAAACPAAEDA